MSVNGEEQAIRDIDIQSGKEKQKYWRMAGCTKGSVSKTKWKKESVTGHVLQHAVYPEQDV